MAVSGARRGPGPGGGRPEGRVAGGRSGAGAATRAQLVAAAVEALREVGFAAASAREIARRAGCHQSQVFYHFGSVVDLLLAALDDVSERRMAAYRQVLDRAGTVTDLLDLAQTVVREDLERGDVAVLTAMITGAQTVPGLDQQVAERLRPWQDFAEEAVRKALGQLPFGQLVPAREAAHALVAGILGLELLGALTGDRTATTALFDRGRSLAGLAGLFGPGGSGTDGGMT